MAKQPTHAEQQAAREAKRKTEMDAAFEREHAKSNPPHVDSGSNPIGTDADPNVGPRSKNADEAFNDEVAKTHARQNQAPNQDEGEPATAPQATNLVDPMPDDGPTTPGTHPKPGSGPTTLGVQSFADPKPTASPGQHDLTQPPPQPHVEPPPATTSANRADLGPTTHEHFGNRDGRHQPTPTDRPLPTVTDRSHSLSPAEYGGPLDQAGRSRGSRSTSTGEPIDMAGQPGQIQRHVAVLRAAAGKFHVPDEVLLAMARALGDAA